ncbi:hypothetical protein EVAR_31219_1 [Eumeta japonica]|uniref:Uncharacterized protein n=1 Tax=Eumeta variegata TaxID=151549 RepID=A0A4C1VYH0_EUMVA|nr:hypothetical protein EVAR_31219_1 [Eumeta japonica]
MQGRWSELVSSFRASPEGSRDPYTTSTSICQRFLLKLAAEHSSVAARNPACPGRTAAFSCPSMPLFWERLSLVSIDTRHLLDNLNGRHHSRSERAHVQFLHGNFHKILSRLRLGVTYEKGVTLGNVTMSHRTRERPAECLASLSHSTMIGLPRAQH